MQARSGAVEAATATGGATRRRAISPCDLAPPPSWARTEPSPWWAALPQPGPDPLNELVEVGRLHHIVVAPAARPVTIDSVLAGR